MVISPALVQPFMKSVTGNDQVALGHTGGAGIALSGLVARLVRGKHTSPSTEDMVVPKGLSFLRDTTVIVALSMAITFLPLVLLPLLGNFGGANSTFSDADYGVFRLPVGLLAKVGQPAVMVGAVVIIAALYAISFAKRRTRGEPTQL